MTSRCARARRDRGLTLLEVVVAISVLVLLAGALLPALAEGRARRRGDDTVARMERLEKAIKAFVEDVHALPAALADLAQNPAPGVLRWGGPYAVDDFEAAPPGVVARLDRDGWDRALRYETLSSFRARLSSAGADGAFGTRDDLVRTVSAIPALRAETIDRLRMLNAASAKHNLDRGGPLSSLFDRLRADLQAAGYLNDDPRFAQDAFGNAFVVSNADAPAIRVTSPVFAFSSTGVPVAVPPVPPCP